MLFHLILNSFLVFCILSCLIELNLWIFKVTNARVRTILRALPFIKIPFDLAVFGLLGNSFFVNLNPFSCQIFVQDFAKKITGAIFQTPLGKIEHLIIPQYIADNIPPHWLLGFLIGAIGLSAVGSIYKAIQFIKSVVDLKNIIRSAQPCIRSILNKTLEATLKKHSVKILVSNEIFIPFAANRRYIVFPEKILSELSSEEFEAIVAHEMEHLRWFDSLLKLFCSSLKALFWWIPAGWWLKKLENDQEKASDASISRYGIKTEAMASAIVKVVKKRKALKLELAGVCHFASSKHSHLERLGSIFEVSLPSKSSSIRAFVGIAICLVTFISFWMC